MSIKKDCLYFVVISTLLSGCGISHYKNDDASSNQTSQPAELSLEGIDKEIADKEEEHGIPSGLLRSISFVESQSNPFAVNSKKKAHYFPTKQEAVKFIKNSVAKGHNNMSIGCFQLHYASHKKRFNSIDDMLSPKANIDYAAKLLKRLCAQYGSWEMAVKKYHAGSSKHNSLYYSKVMKKYNSIR